MPELTFTLVLRISTGSSLASLLTLHILFQDPDAVLCTECNGTWLHVLHHMSKQTRKIQNPAKLKQCPICNGKMAPFRGLINIACEKIQDVQCTVTLQLSGGIESQPRTKLVYEVMLILLYPYSTIGKHGCVWKVKPFLCH